MGKKEMFLDIFRNRLKRLSFPPFHPQITEKREMVRYVFTGEHKIETCLGNKKGVDFGFLLCDDMMKVCCAQCS